jgi:hypothetical protein
VSKISKKKPVEIIISVRWILYEPVILPFPDKHGVLFTPTAARFFQRRQYSEKW